MTRRVGEIVIICRVTEAFLGRVLWLAYRTLPHDSVLYLRIEDAWSRAWWRARFRAAPHTT